MAVQYTNEVDFLGETAPLFVLLDSLHELWQGGEDVSAEKSFEHKTGIYWRRVQHCLLFPDTKSVNTPYYGSTITLLNNGNNQLQSFFKRYPSCQFDLVGQKSMTKLRSLPNLAGIYSYGAYLDDNCNRQTGLLLAHLFIHNREEPAQQLRKTNDLLRLFGGGSFNAEIQPSGIINVYCCRTSL